MPARIGRTLPWRRWGISALIALCLGTCLLLRAPAVVKSPMRTTRLPQLSGLTFTRLPTLHAAAVYLYDPAHAALTLGWHADTPRPMASTTKLMTAVVAVLSARLDQTITIGPEIIPFATADASRMCCPNLAVGQQYTLRDLLYGLLLPSGDDAAAAIAVGVAGSQPAFVARMNAYAAWLGLRDTHFVNPHGLDTPDAANVTTAHDLARLTAFALSLPALRAIVSQPTYLVPANATHPAIRLANTDLLIRPENPTYGLLGQQLGVIGGKTGYTLRAGYCLTVAAEHNGVTLVAVVLGESPDAPETLRFDDVAALLQWGFAQMRAGT